MNEVGRLATKVLLERFLEGGISVKDMLRQWPCGNDPLLDALYNTFVESVGREYADIDVARLGLRAYPSRLIARYVMMAQTR